MPSERDKSKRLWPQLTIRELLLLTLVVAMTAGWWVDRSKLLDGIEFHGEAARRAEKVAADLLRELKRKAAMESMADAASKGMGFTGNPGGLGESDYIIPRWERWEIQFEASSISEYARQLDFFKIELGAVGGREKNIDYAYNLSKDHPDHRSGDKNSRLYPLWMGGSTQASFDRQLVLKAGINRPDAIVIRFYPEEVEDQLAWMEYQNAGKKTVQEFLRTVFVCRPKGGGYDFVVIDQQFRPKPK